MRSYDFKINDVIEYTWSTAGGMSNVGSIPMFFDPNGVGPNGGAEAYLRNNSIISIPKFYVSRNNSIAALSIPRFVLMQPSFISLSVSKQCLVY